MLIFLLNAFESFFLTISTFIIKVQATYLASLSVANALNWSPHSHSFWLHFLVLRIIAKFKFDYVNLLFKTLQCHWEAMVLGRIFTLAFEALTD